MATKAEKLNALERMIVALAPTWAANRAKARILTGLYQRHYDAAAVGRRTSNWTRNVGDANAVNRSAIATLRSHARDLVRNNAWAVEGKRVVVDNTVGWGITPKADATTNATTAKRANELWKRWAETTECDADGRHSFYGLQSLMMGTIVESGEVLVRRRWRRPVDNLSLPIQLQVLEPDFLDVNKDGITTESGNILIQGVEFDKIGRRVAYWLYNRHPGSTTLSVVNGGAYVSSRIPAEDVLHVFLTARPGQVRGITWLAPAILNLKDFDEYEDASLMQAKIAALFAAAVTDVNGDGAGLGEADVSDPLIDTLEPGMILQLPPGRDVKFGTPPVASDNGFSLRVLRRIAAALGITYEDLTGDYSQVNFSSGRMGRLKHWSHVHSWRWNMLVPQLCHPVWMWAMQGAQLVNELPAGELPFATWTPPPMPMIEPDKEGLAYQRLVRAGAMTPSEMVRQQGEDPDAHWEEYGNDLKKLDEKGIILDCDARKTATNGAIQPEGLGEAPADGEATGGKAPAAGKAPAKKGPPAKEEGRDVTVIVADSTERIIEALKARQGTRVVRLNQNEQGRVVGATVTEE